MIVIGDVHNHLINEYLIIVNSTNDRTIQLGDFGLQYAHDIMLKNVDCKKHKVIFGNHEYYPYLNKKHSCKNYSLIDNKIMTIRGAYSIDWYRRIEGVTWFNNEEMNYAELQETIDFYIKHKPQIVLSHDCPTIVRQQIFNIDKISVTCQAMQTMLEFHKPAMWIFGHHHEYINEKIDGINFICLDELKSMKI